MTGKEFMNAVANGQMDLMPAALRVKLEQDT